MKYFIDTNIFLRFLVGDVRKQYEGCRELLKKIKAGEISAVTSDLVIFELIWTLDSYYEKPKNEIIEMIHSLLEFPNLEIENKNLIVEALIIWQEKNIEFNDVYNYSWSKTKSIAKIISYDKHFDKLDLPRKEPS
jgi:predicted nucleic acid-binding protein